MKNTSIKIYENHSKVWKSAKAFPTGQGTRTAKGEGLDKESNQKRVQIARKNLLYDYSVSNEWQYFITLTFDRDKHDCTDFISISKKVSKWLNNYTNRQAPNFKYVLVYELHKDKQHYHIHGLVSGIPAEHMSKARNQKTGKLLKDKNGTQKWNFLPWQKTFGHTLFLELYGNIENTAKYITKYIGKTIGDSQFFGKQQIKASKGLSKPPKYAFKRVSNLNTEDYYNVHRTQKKECHSHISTLYENDHGQMCRLTNFNKETGEKQESIIELALKLFSPDILDIVISE